jgi:hypothetical protein
MYSSYTALDFQIKAVTLKTTIMVVIPVDSERASRRILSRIM